MKKSFKEVVCLPDNALFEERSDLEFFPGFHFFKVILHHHRRDLSQTAGPVDACIGFM